MLFCDLGPFQSSPERLRLRNFIHLYARPLDGDARSGTPERKHQSATKQEAVIASTQRVKVTRLLRQTFNGM